MIHVKAYSGGLHHVRRDAQLDGLVEIRDGAMILDQGVIHPDSRLPYARHDQTPLKNRDKQEVLD